MNELLPKTVDDYRMMIETHRAFTQANYGDGEWGCLLGRSGRNSNGEDYNRAIASALRKTISEPRFTFYGWNPGNKIIDEAQQYLADNDIRVCWVYKEILANANCRGEIGSFFKALQARNTLLVGPEHLKSLEIIKHNSFVEVPTFNAFNCSVDTISAIIYQTTTHCCDCILFCSGMATNTMMWQLCKLMPETTTMLDMGAIFDPYVCVLSRSGYRKDNFLNKGLELNLAAIDRTDLLMKIKEGQTPVWQSL